MLFGLDIPARCAIDDGSNLQLAPSLLPRNVVEPLIHAALKLARCLQYAGLGTFEFLVNGISHEWIFMEINPRIQVEHTVTGEIKLPL